MNKKQIAKQTRWEVCQTFLVCPPLCFEWVHLTWMIYQSHHHGLLSPLSLQKKSPDLSKTKRNILCFCCGSKKGSLSWWVLGLFSDFHKFLWAEDCQFGLMFVYLKPPTFRYQSETLNQEVLSPWRFGQWGRRSHFVFLGSPRNLCFETLPVLPLVKLFNYKIPWLEKLSNWATWNKVVWKLFELRKKEVVGIKYKVMNTTTNDLRGSKSCLILVTISWIQIADDMFSYSWISISCLIWSSCKNGPSFTVGYHGCKSQTLRYPISNWIPTGAK